MPDMIVGYKLIDSTGAVLETWGGTWGQCPGVPNPIKLPNGDIVHAPSLNEDYDGYSLIEWIAQGPEASVPLSVSPRQVRLLLLQQNLLADVEAMIAAQDEATRITWEYAIEFRRDDPLLSQLASSLGLSEAQIDKFFVAAAGL